MWPQPIFEENEEEDVSYTITYDYRLPGSRGYYDCPDCGDWMMRVTETFYRGYCPVTFKPGFFRELTDHHCLGCNGHGTDHDWYYNDGVVLYFPRGEAPAHIVPSASGQEVLVSAKELLEIPCLQKDELFRKLLSALGDALVSLKLKYGPKEEGESLFLLVADVSG